MVATLSDDLFGGARLPKGLDALSEKSDLPDGLESALSTTRRAVV
jgi:hypothetical protein